MTVKNVLTQPVVTCQPDTNVAMAIHLMWEDRDICIAWGTRNRSPAELTAREMMGPSPLTCKPTDDIRAAPIIMRNAQIRRLPVLAGDGTLAGIVSVADIVLVAGQGFGTTGASVSFAERVAALRAIFARSGDRVRRSVAARAF